MEYHLGGCRKTYLLLGVTSHFSRESTSQASGTNIFISKTRLRHASDMHFACGNDGIIHYLWRCQALQHFGRLCAVQ